MATSRISTSSILQGFPKSRSLLAGNASYIPVVPVEYLVIAGGGGTQGGELNAGTNYGFGGGGGGAGGLLYGSASLNLATPYSVTVGGGGSGWNGNATNSVFSSYTAIGGSGGGRQVACDTGGSGGGAGDYFFQGTVLTGTRGLGTAGQGNNGGTAVVMSTRNDTAAGGGGGAGAVGGNGASQIGGNGGVGSNTYSTWASATSSGASGYYAGGGGASGNTASGSGGLGGGGAVSNGTANTGGGAGAGMNSVVQNGGSGIVIIRYADTYSNAASTTGSPTLYTTGGYKYYKFTGSGSITF